MARCNVLAVLVMFCVCRSIALAQLQENYYQSTCPNVEAIVRQVVQQKINQTFVTVPATIRLYFHDCFVHGCDASILIASTPNNSAEKDNPINLSLAGDGFDTVIKGKAAVEAQCPNTVSCADILAIAARDAINLAGGPFYNVELGRLDGLVSTSDSVTGNLPLPTFNVDELNAMFGSHNLTQNDMVALSACHTVGFSHCSQFSSRLYNFSTQSATDPTMNSAYANQLKQACPIGVDPRIAVDLDPTTPNTFDKVYYQNLRNGKGLLNSDQVLYQDQRTRGVVNAWSKHQGPFVSAFIEAITKMGRIDVKTTATGNGNIRADCSVFNS